MNLFHCVIYTRVQCSYVYRTDFLDTQILVVPVELEAKIAAYHSVSVELGQCLILKSASTGGFLCYPGVISYC